ncbi:MAG: hypothetical protein ACKO5K_09710, partial [Armatimonadota bacterium]
MGSRLVWAVACAAIALPASAQTIFSSERGWYNEFGLHQTNNDNYIVGAANTLDGNIFRNFFVFDIPTLAPGQDYTLALLQLYNPAALVGVPETFSLWSYEGSIASLVAGTGGPAAVEDLGDGTLFGTATIDAAAGNTINVELNADGLAAVNARQGQQIAFGGSLTNRTEGPNAYAFGFSGNTQHNPADGDVRLTLRPTDGGNTGGNTGGDAVPEPGEWAAMGILGAGLAGL